MQHAIVPYVPPGCSTRASHQRSFANFVRNGGHVNQLTFGASSDDVELAPLISDKKEASEALQLMRATNRQARVTQIATILALMFAVVVFGGLGVVVWRVNQNMNSLEATVRPHANQIVNATVGMMQDLGGSFHNMHEISGYTTQLASVAGGTSGSASTALNNTAVITQRLASFLAHPTIQLSLGGGA